MKDMLNPYQRSSIRITVQSFENNLREALTWLDGREENGVLYSAKLHLSGARRQEALQEIGEALEQIAVLRDLFDLEKEDENALFRIRGEMAVAWANLLDSRSTKLKRFGEVHPDLHRQLDPSITRLADIANRLETIFSEDTSNGSQTNVED